jgi:hypothetical protein
MSANLRVYARAGRFAIAIALLLLGLLLTGLDASRFRESRDLMASYAPSLSFSSSSSAGLNLPLDPVAQPGWIEGDTWVSANPEAPMHNWIRRMMDKEEGPEMDWMRNKTIVSRPTIALHTSPQNITSSGKG